MERNDKHRLDRLLREKLDAPQHPHDAGLWQDIERELGKRKRRGFFMRKRNIFLLLFLVCGSATMFAVYQFNAAHREAPSETTVKNSNTTQPSAVHRDVSEKNTQPNNAATSDYTPSTQNTTQFSEETQASPNAEYVEPIINTTAAATVQSNLTTTSSTSATESNQTKDVSVSNDGQKTDVIENDKEAIALISTEVKPTADENKSEIVIDKPTTRVEEIHAETVTAIDNDASTTSVDTVANDIDIHQAVLADTTAVASLTKSEEATEADKSISNPLSQKRFTWSIAFQAQLNHVSKQINADAFSQLYLQRRSREEQSARAVSYGLRAGVEYKRFMLQSGVGVRTYAEDIYYENRSQRYLVKSISYVQDSSIYYSYDTTTVSEVNNALDAFNGRNVNRYVEIPLLIGYRIGNSNFSVRPSIGVSFAKPLRWSSMYLNDETNDLVDPQPTHGLTPFVKSFVSELSVGLALSNHFYLDASATYNRNLQSVFKNSSGVDQRYRSIGGGIALRYRF